MSNSYSGSMCGALGLYEDFKSIGISHNEAMLQVRRFNVGLVTIKELQLKYPGLKQAKQQREPSWRNRA